MHKKKVLGLALSTVLALGILSGCGAKATPTATGALKDGTFKAEASDFDSKGWKPFVEITVKGGKITETKFDYTNKEGKLKTQDADYNKNMLEKSTASVKTNPQKYSPELAKALVEKQDPAKVDTVTGATSSTKNFKELAAKAIEDGAKKGNSAVIKVVMPEEKK